MHLDPTSLFSNCQSLNIESLVPVDDTNTFDVPQENSNYFQNENVGTESFLQGSNWKGVCGFNLFFGPQEAPTKTTAWTYSEVKDKLYVRKGMACPFNFSVCCTPLPGTVIRATAMFTNPEHHQDVVRRCLYHSDPNDSSNNGVLTPDHLIQCLNVQAIYETDASSARHSVKVPYEQPPAGMEYSTYLYKFMCLSSCVGGLNRRPIKVIFTLERNGCCLGRRSVEVKICACPGRDRKNDEKHVRESYQTSSRIPIESELNMSNMYFGSDSEPPKKKKKVSNSTDTPSYTIKVYDKRIYEILLVLKNALELSTNLNPQFLSSLGKNCIKNFKKENDPGESD